MTIAPDDADLAVLGEFGRRLEEVPEDPRTEWHRTARPDQLLPGDPFRIVYYQGGRGSGKTRSSAQGLAEIIQSDPEPGGQFGVIGPTYRDAWTVQVEGESGLLRALGTTPGEVKHGTSRIVEYAHRSYGEIGLRNGHIIFVDSADDGAIRVQGKNLRACWCGEIGLWSRWATAFDESVKFAVRKGSAKIICDGTPKVSRPARALIRRFLRGEEPGVIVRRLRTVDNAANLSDAFLQAVVGASKGTRLERQELEGELLDDIENALWTRALLEDIQVPAVGAEGGIAYLHQAVIGVDPSDGNEDSDEQAYTVAGKGNPTDAHLYVAESWGGQMAPAAFARKVILKAVAWNARIVVERNHGGAWLTETFHQVMKELDAAGKLPDGRKPRVETIWASQAKRTRAEPVSALYERDVVRHAGGPFVELEDQQCIASGTLVATAEGGRPIEAVAPGDYVWTRAGLRLVIWSGFTGVRKTLTITTSEGSLTCTGDHPVYVAGRGFTRADEVQSGDTMMACRFPSSGHGSSSRGSATTWTMTATTRRADVMAGDFSTGRSGLPPMAVPFPRAGMFTTRTTTAATMTRPTWLPYPRAPTTSATSTRTARLAQPWIPSRSAAASGKTSGPARNTWTTPAANAVSLTSPAPTSRPTTAPRNAATAPWAAVVLSVSASGVKPVYDLTVSGQPEFFAGGLLVHNCSFTGAAGERSPDRLDSCVFALTPFLNASFLPPGKPGKRDWAGSGELRDLGVNEETRAHNKMRQIVAKAAPDIDGAPWDLDGFSPTDDELVRSTPRNNVRAWR